MSRTSLTMVRYIDRFVVSVYFDDSALSELWRRWLAAVAPHVELHLRVHADGWDRWTGDERVDDARAQQLYDSCWYRTHCVTVERGRLFACSRASTHRRRSAALRLKSSRVIGGTCVVMAAMSCTGDACSRADHPRRP